MSHQAGQHSEDCCSVSSGKIAHSANTSSLISYVTSATVTQTMADFVIHTSDVAITAERLTTKLSIENLFCVIKMQMAITTRLIASLNGKANSKLNIKARGRPMPCFSIHQLFNRFNMDYKSISATYCRLNPSQLLLAPMTDHRFQLSLHTFHCRAKPNNIL